MGQLCDRGCMEKPGIGSAGSHIPLKSQVVNYNGPKVPDSENDGMLKLWNAGIMEHW
jgi:hypothetical protein